MSRLPPEGATYFQFSTVTLWAMRIAAPAGFGIAIFGAVFIVEQIWTATRFHPQLIFLGFGVALFAILAPFGWKELGLLRDRVAVNEDGVWSLPHKGEPSFIAWRNVTRVRAYDLMKRLVVSDGSGAQPIRLEYQLNDFPALSAFVLSHTAPETRAIIAPRPVFHHFPIIKIILLVAPVLVWLAVWEAFERGENLTKLIFPAAIPLLAWPMMILDPLSLEIAQGVIIIAYPGWRRRIAFRDIVSAELGEVSPQGNVSVLLNLRNKKPITLSYYREGSLALAETLQIALRRGGFTTQAGG